MSNFNDEIGWWLSCQIELFKENDVQKALYEIESEHLKHFPDITEREQNILKEVIPNALKLSFILKNNPKEAEKLVNYLS